MKPERAPGFSLKLNQPALVVGAVLLLVVLWNFWLPFAQDYFNQVTKATLPPNVDFYAYFTAGQRFNAGANPYYYGEAQPGSALISEYLYPPTFLPLFGALARLPYDAARTLWLGLYALVYLAAFTALAMGLPRAERLTFAGLGALLTATSFPLLLHIRNGQADVLVIGLALLSFSLYGRGKRGASALLLALAGLLKVSPLLLLIYYLLYLRDWRYTLAVLAAGVGLAGISLLAVPFHYYPEYVMYILPVVSGGTGYYLNQSLLKYLADNPLLAQGVSAAGLGLFALFAGWAGSQQRRADGFETTAAFILNLLVILVFQGKAWSMAYVWAILPCALVLTYLLHHAAKPWQLLAAGAASALMVAKIYGYPPLDSLNLLGALVMGGLLMVVCWPRTTKRKWRRGMIVTADDLVRVGLAILIGGLIGAEREYRDKAAGFRTLIFITLGSTLFTMFSARLGGPEDPVRIAANIVTGIGFLGAGTILRGEHGVTGLTTAAAIWLSAALGLGIGGGDLGLVLLATGAILIVLWIFPYFERWIDRAQHTRMYELVIRQDDEKVKQLEQLFVDTGLRTHHHRRCRRGEVLTLSWLATAKPARHDAVTDRLLHDPEVLELRY